MTRQQTFDGVIFDFDGVIADTEPLHWRAFNVVLADYDVSIPWAQYLEVFVGFDDRDAFRELKARYPDVLSGRPLDGLIEIKADAFDRLVREGRDVLHDGIARLIRALDDRVQLAICSGALRSDIDPILEGNKLDAHFDIVVTADRVERSKPDPEGYLLAANELFPDDAASPQRCLALEDTPTGIRSAVAAGVVCLGVAQTYPAEALRDAGAAGVVETVSEIEPDRLINGGYFHA